MTEERRKELVKDVKKKGEAVKVAVRNIRRDANDTIKKLQKANEMSEDDQEQAEDEIQKMTDKYIPKKETIIDEKAKEILTVYDITQLGDGNLQVPVPKHIKIELVKTVKEQITWRT